MATDLLGLRVLVVDDNDDDGLLAQIVLEQAGARADVASSVVEGLEAFARRAPDAVVCDLRFGEGEPNGYAFIESLARSPHDPGVRVPVVLITGYIEDTTRRQLIAAGFDDVCEKPCEFATLIRMISRLAGHPGVRN